MSPTYVLRLYVAGHTANSLRAVATVRQLVDAHLGTACRVEIIDLLREPLRASDDDIIATPTLVKKSPLPETRIIGNLADINRTLASLGIPPKPPS